MASHFAKVKMRAANRRVPKMDRRIKRIVVMLSSIDERLARIESRDVETNQKIEHLEEVTSKITHRDNHTEELISKGHGLGGIDKGNASYSSNSIRTSQNIAWNDNPVYESSDDISLSQINFQVSSAAGKYNLFFDSIIVYIVLLPK